jgi:hypothetical protein
MALVLRYQQTTLPQHRGSVCEIDTLWGAQLIDLQSGFLVLAVGTVNELKQKYS